MSEGPWTRYEGRVWPGDSGAEVTLAGALAEHGVRRTTFSVPGAAAQALMAGETDLPGVLAGAPVGSVLRSEEHGFEAVLAPCGWTYATPDHALALALAGPGGDVAATSR